MNTYQMILLFLVFFPMVGSFIGYGIGKKNKKGRDIWVCLVTFLVLAGSLLLIGRNSKVALPGVCGLGLHFEGDGFRILLVVLSAVIWFMTTLFSMEYFSRCQNHNRNRYHFFMLLSLGATMGVFLSADFYTTLIFFEIMSFTSFVLVMHDEGEKAMYAAHSYLAVAVIGGLATLMGLFILYSKAGTLQFTELTAYMAQAESKTSFYVAGVLILVGFAAKAGLFPLHTWLPEAHPAAPTPASMLLSCVLTKTGVFGMIAVSCKVFLHDVPWGELLVILSAITMALGGILAVFSVDLKRTLACSSMSQIGFIAVAIGMQCLLGEHNALAASGTALHLVNHSLLKLVLFLIAGVVFMNLQKSNLNEIRGWGKDKPLLKICFLMGLLGLGGIPLWNGYISKTLIHESMVEYIAILEGMGASTVFMHTVEWVFLISGGFTLAYMTKIFVAVFVDPAKNPVQNKALYMNKVTAAVLVVGAILLPVLGIFPYQTQNVLADISLAFMGAHAPEHAVHYFVWANLKGAVICVLVAAVVYFVVVRRFLMEKDAEGNSVYLDCWPSWLNLEKRVYRPLLLQVLPFIGAFFSRLAATLTDGMISVLRMVIFNYDNGKVIPPEDKYFSAYTGGETDKTVYREGFARSLLMIGIGLAIAMLYILV